MKIIPNLFKGRPIHISKMNYVHDSSFFTLFSLISKTVNSGGPQQPAGLHIINNFDPLRAKLSALGHIIIFVIYPWLLISKQEKSGIKNKYIYAF